jgi:hypothetical protein
MSPKKYKENDVVDVVDGAEGVGVILSLLHVQKDFGGSQAKVFCFRAGE